MVRSGMLGPSTASCKVPLSIDKAQSGIKITPVDWLLRKAVEFRRQKKIYDGRHFDSTRQEGSSQPIEQEKFMKEGHHGRPQVSPAPVAGRH